MAKIQKILMIVSLAFMVICLGATVWAATYFNDASFYGFSAFFVFAIIWFGITIYKSYRKDDSSKKDK